MNKDHNNFRSDLSEVGVGVWIVDADKAIAEATNLQAPAVVE
jgi:hypothetical protein